MPRGVREPDFERGRVERPRGVYLLRPRGVNLEPRGVRGVLPLRGVVPRGVRPVRPGAAGVDAARDFALALGRWCDVFGLLEHWQTPQFQYGMHIPCGAGTFGFLGVFPPPGPPAVPEGGAFGPGAAGLGAGPWMTE